MDVYGIFDLITVVFGPANSVIGPSSSQEFEDRFQDPFSLFCPRLRLRVRPQTFELNTFDESLGCVENVETGQCDKAKLY